MSKMDPRAELVVQRDSSEKAGLPGVIVAVLTDDGQEFILKGVRSFTKRIEANSLILGVLEVSTFQDEVSEVRNGQAQP